MTTIEHATADDPASKAALAYADSGQAERLGEALAACADAAYTQARRLLRVPADAEDAVQNAFLALVRSARRYDGRSPFAAWVARSVHTAAIDLLRRRRRHAPLPDLASLPEHDEGHPLAERVAAAVRDLGESYRAVVDLHYFAGLSQEATAGALGLTTTAVAVRLHRAREHLRRRLAGVVAGEAGVVAALVAAPTWAAPEAVSVALRDRVMQAATAPASASPLAPIGRWIMHHPLITVTSVAGAIALAVTLLGGGEAAPPAPAVATPRWSAQARELLTYLPQDPAFAIGADLGLLRAAAPSTRPSSLLADPEAATLQVALTRLFQSMAQESGGWWNGRVAVPFLEALAAPDAAGLIFGRSARRPVPLEVLQAETFVRPTSHLPMNVGLFDLGSSTVTDWRQRFLDAKGKGRGPLMDLHGLKQSHGAFRGDFCTAPPDTPELIGLSDRAFLYASMPVLEARARQIPTVPDRWATHPAFSECDGTALFASWAALAQAHGDHMGIDRLIGRGWRGSSPNLRCRFDAVDGAWQVDGRLTLWKQAPTLPVLLLAAWPFLYEDPDLLAAAGRVRLRPPSAGFCEIPTDAVAWVALGCDDADLGVLAGALDLPTPLLRAWSGDALLVARPGTMLPALHLRLGLRRDTDVQRDLGQLLAGLGATSSPAGTARAAWNLSTSLPLVPPLEVTLHADRIEVVTVGAAPVTQTRRETCPGLGVGIDLARAVTTWRGLLPVAGPQGAELAAALPPAVVLSRHLEPWRIDVTQHDDGLAWRERGLPLTLLAPAALAWALERDDCDLELDYHNRLAEARADKRSAEIWARHRDRCEALRRIAESWDGLDRQQRQTPPRTLPELLQRLDLGPEVMAPFFDGRIPSTAELAELGRSGLPAGETTLYTAPGRRPGGRLIIPARINSVSEALLFQNIGGFALPLDDQWSLLWCPNWTWSRNGGPSQSLLSLVPRPVDGVIPTTAQ